MGPFAAVLLWSATLLGDSEPNPSKADRGALQGTWVVTYAQMNGKKAPPDVLKRLTVTFKDDAITIGQSKATFTLDASKDPKHIDMKSDDGVFKGIYILDGDKLTMCWQKGTEHNPRPTEFSKDDEKKRLAFLELKRAKADPPKKDGP